MRRIAILLSFGVGFLSLSQEIAWVRVLSFSQEGRPHAFSMVLVAFLLGISLGSMIGRRVCARAWNVLRVGGWILLIAACVDVGALYVCSTALVETTGSPRRLLALLALIGTCAALKGILFPIVHHLGTEADERRVGRSVSQVYLANVLGSTLGPIAVGFGLLDIVSVESVFGLVALGTALLGALALLRSAPLAAAAWLVPTLAVALAVHAAWQPPGIITRLITGGKGSDRLRHVLQNKHGVIHVLAQEKPGMGDITFGGNVYDGRISVDMSSNLNWLDRGYLVAALHPQPRRVLVIGMSTGAWAAAILGIPGVEHVDIVEINPAYLDIASRYPEVAPVLKDPRARIHVDDGRRWLRQHPQATYDVVIQNTTFHWRAYTTMLLSQEYFRQVRSHLAPGGIFAANTTYSLDAYATAASVFEHAARYKNFVYMSDSPFVKRADSVSVLKQCSVWGRPAFEERAFEQGQMGNVLAHAPLESVQDYLARTRRDRNPRVISDLNLMTEYRHGSALPFEWLRPLLPTDSGPLVE